MTNWAQSEFYWISFRFCDTHEVASLNLSFDCLLIWWRRYSLEGSFGGSNKFKDLFNFLKRVGCIFERAHGDFNFKMIISEQSTGLQQLLLHISFSHFVWDIMKNLWIFYHFITNNVTWLDLLIYFFLLLIVLSIRSFCYWDDSWLRHGFLLESPELENAFRALSFLLMAPLDWLIWTCVCFFWEKFDASSAMTSSFLCTFVPRHHWVPFSCWMMLHFDSCWNHSSPPVQCNPFQKCLYSWLLFDISLFPAEPIIFLISL